MHHEHRFSMDFPWMPQTDKKCGGVCSMILTLSVESPFPATGGIKSQNHAEMKDVCGKMVRNVVGPESPVFCLTE
jgi:hypothetical protein